MDTNKLIERVRNMLLAPKTEWQIVATEATSVGDLYKSYIFILAAIPAVMQFLKLSVIGTSILFAGRVRFGVMSGLTSMIISYALSLATVYVMAFVIDALATNFGGERNRLQAFKLVAYAYTASWVASIGMVVPGLWVLTALAGAFYSIYLLYLGLPLLMKCPSERSMSYVGVVIVLGVVLSIVGTSVIGGVSRFGSYGGPLYSNNHDDVQFDKGSALGKLQSYTANLERASKKLEAAQKSDDAKAQQDALAGTLGAALGGEQVDALAPERLKSFVPESLGGRQRKSLSVERNKTMGMQTATATASFGDDSGHNFELQITDLGGAKGVLGLANLFDAEGEKQTDAGYERTYRENDRLVSEKWDSNNASGEYSIVIGERFTVKIEGHAANIDALKTAMAELNLSGLEQLRGEGVAQN